MKVRETPPRTIQELRDHKFPPFPEVTEFDIKHWIASAVNALNDGELKWKEWRLEPDLDGIRSNKIEEAFLDIRKAALLSVQMKRHPGYEKMRALKLPEYYTSIDLTGRLSEGVRTNGVITLALEKRTAAWNLIQDALKAKSKESDSIIVPVNSSNGGSNPPNSRSSVSKVNGKDSLDTLLDDYSNHSSNPITPTNTTPTGSTSPVLNMEQRLAALRSNGLDTQPLKPTMRSNVPLSSTTNSPIASTSHSTAPLPSSTVLTPSIKPKPLKKPDGLMNLTRSTPPSSPRSPILSRNDEVNGAAAGSVGAYGWEESNVSNGNQGARSPVSPGSFGGQFPSLDELENRFSSNNPYSSPPLKPTILAPSSPTPTISIDNPPIRSNRPPLPPTPRSLNSNNGDLVNVEDDTRLRDNSRAEAMMKLAGNSNPNSNSNNLKSYSSSSTIPNGNRNSFQSSPHASPSFSPAPLPPIIHQQPPPPSKSPNSFTTSYSNEILPAELYTILFNALSTNSPGGTRILLLDIREREDFERERIIGESVCLEPIILRNGVTSTDLESSLAVAPASEYAIFDARHLYDRVVIYDQSSTSLPNSMPPSTSSKAQHLLFNLTNAIYEREFRKSLKKQPVLLVGGWKAWKKLVGAKGITGTGGGTNSTNVIEESKEESRDEFREERRRVGMDELGRVEAKRANRETTIISPDYMRGSVSNGTYTIPGNSNVPNYVPSNYYPIGAGAVLVSAAELALPPTAIQRSGGPLPPYDQFSYPTSSRPSYTQPNINNFGSYPGPTMPNSPSSNSLNLSQNQNQFRNEYADNALNLSQSQSQQPQQQIQQQSFNNYSNAPRPSIDYPSLRPAVNQSSRPMTSSSNNSSPVMPLQTLTRPPPVQPAPLRSNSSFSGVSVIPYSSSSSTYGANLSFGEDTIGLTGLKNLGNTCYMNSTIQCLSATIPFARYFREGVYKGDINMFNPLGTKGALASAVAELIRAIWQQQYTSLSPVTFRENICRWAPQFRGSDQHDAQEFLGFLLDGLHEDLNYVRSKPKPIEMTPEREHDLETLPQQVMSQREWDIYRMRNDSFVVRSFQGQFRNQMRCLTCNKTSTTYNTFMSLSIPIPVSRNKVTLEDCLATFVREEILDKEDAWFCPRCKCPRKATKKLSLARLPPILLIHLKRFSFKGPFSDKIETQVTYPLSGLDLTGFVPAPLFDPRAPPLTSAAKGQVYDLYGVTNHYGTLSSGHYTAYVRNLRDWHNIGDSKVTQVNPEVVQSARSAYILFFRLR